MKNESAPPAPADKNTPKPQPAKTTEQAQDEIKTTEPAAKTHTHRTAGRSGSAGR